MKLNNMQIIKLIALYRESESLWNMRSPTYRIYDLKIKALDNIAKKMHLPVDVVKKKIRGLRSTYTAELKKVVQFNKPGSAAKDAYVPSVFWFNEMRFLDNSIVLRKTEESSKQVASLFAKINKTQILKLIALYRERELLWNMRSPTYRRDDLKTKALDDIANEMHLPVDVVNTKIRELRSTYTAELKKVVQGKKSGSAAEEAYVPSVFWFDEMRFLDDSIVSQKSEDDSNQEDSFFSKLNRTQILKLIALYRERELLWNVSSPTYRRNDLKIKALANIANEMHLPVDVVKRKIRGLRSTYTAELKKVVQGKKSGSAAEEAYLPSVFWFNKMRFLDNSIVLRNSEENSNQVKKVYEPNTLQQLKMDVHDRVRNRTQRKFEWLGQLVVSEINKIQDEEIQEAIVWEIQKILHEALVKDRLLRQEDTNQMDLLEESL